MQRWRGGLLFAVAQESSLGWSGSLLSGCAINRRSRARSRCACSRSKWSTSIGIGQKRCRVAAMAWFMWSFMGAAPDVKKPRIAGLCDSQRVPCGRGAGRIEDGASPSNQGGGLGWVVDGATESNGGYTSTSFALFISCTATANRVQAFTLALPLSYTINSPHCQTPDEGGCSVVIRNARY